MGLTYVHMLSNNPTCDIASYSQHCLHKSSFDEMIPPKPEGNSMIEVFPRTRLRMVRSVPACAYEEPITKYALQTHTSHHDRTLKCLPHMDLETQLQVELQ